MRVTALFCMAAVFATGLLSGCVGTPIDSERNARSKTQQVGDALPAGRSAGTVALVLPVLGADSPMSEFMRFAVLNHPEVAAAYFDWRASVEAITPARSLPDPQLTFQADITDTLMSFMPGLMFDIMTRGKRTAMGNEMAAGSDVAYRTFVATVLRTAANMRLAWIELAYIEDVRHLHAAAANAVDEQLALVNADYATGRGMGSLEKQMKLLNDAAAHHTHHASLGDRLAAAHTRFKSALGLDPAAPDPVWPHATLVTTPLPSEAELWSRLVVGNPELGRMRAMVEMSLASVEVARQTRTPNFALGLMADLKASPLMLRPTASVSLPLWRDKIAATVASAEFRHDAALARVNAEQLNLAAELAQMLYMVRETDRMIAYIDDTALPNIGRVSAAAEVGLQSGMGGGEMIPAARGMALTMQMERVETLRQRESAVTNLLLMVADVAPADLSFLADAAQPSSAN